MKVASLVASLRGGGAARLLAVSQTRVGSLRHDSGDQITAAMTQLSEHQRGGTPDREPDRRDAARGPAGLRKYLRVQLEEMIVLGSRVER